MATKKKAQAIKTGREPDLYTIPQTAQVLGLSIKRVRQLLSEGKLNKYSDNPQQVIQLDVLALKQKREQQGKITRPATVKADALASALESMNATFRTQLDLIASSNQRNEENYLRQINELRDEVNTLRADKSRKWWQR